MQGVDVKLYTPAIGVLIALSGTPVVLPQHPYDFPDTLEC